MARALDLAWALSTGSSWQLRLVAFKALSWGVRVFISQEDPETQIFKCNFPKVKILATN